MCNIGVVPQVQTKRVQHLTSVHNSYIKGARQHALPKNLQFELCTFKKDGLQQVVTNIKQTLPSSQG